MGALPRLRTGRAAELGRAGERAAADLLRSRGYQVVGAGFLARRGELDLICRRGRELVEGVGSRKRRALKAAAAEYRALAEWRGPIRYAVVGVTVRPDGGLETELIEDPFD